MRNSLMSLVFFMFLLGRLAGAADVSADFLMTPDNMKTPPTVFVDSSLSRGDISSFEWKVTDPNGTEGNYLSPIKTIYAAVYGMYHVQLTVTDAKDGTQMSRNNFFFVDQFGVSLPPQVKLTSDISEGQAPLTVTFSYDAQSDRDIMWVEFDIYRQIETPPFRSKPTYIKVDRIRLIEPSTGIFPYVFTKEGVYVVTYQVTDINMLAAKTPPLIIQVN